MRRCALSLAAQPGPGEGSRRAGASRATRAPGRPSPAFAALALLASLLLVVGCYEDRWETSQGLRAPDQAVARALGDLGHGSSDLSASALPEIHPPAALRPCCAFGADLEVEVGRVPVPRVEIGNVIGPENVGPHRYDNGAVSLNIEDTRGWVDEESNGLVYTCRGGFVDMAHVRDNADITIALAAGLARNAETGGIIELPSQGAKIRAVLEPIDPQLLERHGRRELIIPLAQWLDFQVSIWHEIATWYGYASLAEWPEKISAFSLEDLYSNLLGGKIAGGILEEQGARSDEEYDRNMDAWIEAVLERLQAFPQEQGKQAAHAVDGIWWNSSKRIPDWQLVKRRNFDIGAQVSPWLVRDATPPAPPDRRFEGCDPDVEPLILRHANGFEGVAFRDLVTLEIDVDDQLASAGFAFPRPGNRRVTQDDYPHIIAAIQRENAAAFGEPADHP